jgi:HSP20 family molecular chaperone IbpA
MTQEPGRTESGRYTVRAQNAWRPPTDVYETDGALVVKVEIPGVAEQDFQITIAGRRLVIAGARNDPASKLGYHNMEIRYGAFRTEIRMPWLADEDAIEASYEDGFLYVRLPRAQRRQVQVT